MRSTFSRTFFPAALILLAALLLVGASFHALVKNFLSQQAMDSLQNDAETISALASAYYSEGTLSDRDFLVNLSVASQVSGADAVICDVNGRLVICSDNPLGCPDHQDLRISSRAFMETLLQERAVHGEGHLQMLYDEERYFVGITIDDAFSSQPIGIVLVSMPTAATVNVLTRMTDIYILVSLLVVAVSVVVMTVITRRETKPLQQMARTANAFSHGDLTARVTLEGEHAQEVEELVLSFNNMAAFLEKSEYQRQEFVANVSHELKTPMTTIGGYVDGILDGTIPAERHRHYLQIVSDETKRLNRLVRSMLDISRLQDQGGIPEEKKTRFDLEECAGQVLITFEQKILQKGCNVDVVMPEHPVYTFANQDYITQVVYNLLDNAVKFCPEGGTLGMRIRVGDSKAYVSIFNDGQTIPPEELPLVFDRFHKIDKSRAQNRDSWGLGLYIVKTIIGSHGEDISVSSGNGRTEFTFTMPLVN